MRVRAEHDYDKVRDSSFYGIALEDWSHFDRDSLTPIPDLRDPLVSLFDPKGSTINGNRLRSGASRFVGREIIRTKQEMNEHGGFFNLTKLESDEKETAERQRTAQARDDHTVHMEIHGKGTAVLNCSWRNAVAAAVFGSYGLGPGGLALVIVTATA